MVKIINTSFKGGPLFYEGNYKIEGLSYDALRDLDLREEIHQGGPLQPYHEQEMYDKVRRYCHEHGLTFENDLL